MLTLVNYSSSDESSDLEHSLPCKKKCIAKECIVKKDSAVTEKQDPPNESDPHDGRIRSFAHERGNWASYVHIPCTLNDTIKELQEKLINASTNFKIHPISNVHISLTRTVVLHHHWIESFVESVERRIKGIALNMLYFSHLKIYRNEEGTRAFIGMVLDHSSSKSAERLVDICDDCLKEYKLPKFYEERSLHASICWWAENGTPENTDCLELEAFFEEAFHDCYQDFRFECNEILCEAGNRTYKMKLK